MRPLEYQEFSRVSGGSNDPLVLNGITVSGSRYSYVEWGNIFGTETYFGGHFNYTPPSDAVIIQAVLEGMNTYVEDLKDRIDAAGGLTREHLEEIEAHPHLGLQDVLEPGIYAVEFDVELGNVNTFGEHRHFLLVDPHGDHQILTGYPEVVPGTDRLQVGITAYADSIHNPLNQTGDDDAHRFERVDTGNRDVDAIWAAMVTQAEQINAAGLNYNFLSQNSNSVNSTLAAAGGIPTDSSGFAPGASNTLFDELAGGAQAAGLPGGGLLGSSAGSSGLSDAAINSSEPTSEYQGLAGSLDSYADTYASYYEAALLTHLYRVAYGNFSADWINHPGFQ